jgi:hypothetical protein
MIRRAWFGSNRRARWVRYCELSMPDACARRLTLHACGVIRLLLADERKRRAAHETTTNIRV